MISDRKPRCEMMCNEHEVNSERRGYSLLESARQNVHENVHEWTLAPILVLWKLSQAY